MGLVYSFKKSEKKKESIYIWYKRRIKRVLPVYFIIAIVFYLLNYRTILEMLYNLLFFNFIIDGKRDFWYIFAVMVCYSIFPFYLKATKKIDFRFVLILYIIFNLVLCIFIFYFFPLYYGKWEIFLWRLPCFGIGCHLGIILTKNLRKDFFITVLILSLIGIILVIIFGLTKAPNYILRNEFTYLSLVFIIIFCILFNFLFRIKLLQNIFQYLGKRSLELYLSHVSFGIFFMNYVKEKILVYLIVSFLIAELIYYLKLKIERN